MRLPLLQPISKGQRFLFILLIPFLGLMLPACRTTKKTATTITEHKSPVDLFTKLRESQLQFEWLSTRIAAQATIGKTNHSFSANLRMRKDSVIWVSITTMLGIEVARAMITPDSIKFINRLAPEDQKYFEGDFNSLSKLIGVDLDLNFSFLQSIITGNYYPHYADSVFKATEHQKFYNLGTVNRHRLKKSINDKDDSDFGVIKHDIRIEPDHFRIIRVLMNDLAENRKFETNYSKFKEIDGQWFPHELEVDINDKEKTYVRLAHSKVTLNKPQRFPFNVPD